MQDLSSAKIHWLKNHHPKNHQDYREISRWSSSMPATFPRYIYLEVGWDCNLDCTFCSKVTRRKQKRVMQLPDYFRVVDEFAEQGGYYLAMFLWNEPLLHLDMLLPVIEHAKHVGVPLTAITTNTTPLTESVMHSLCDAGLDVMHFSFEGANPEIYRRVRNANPEKTAERIRLAARISKERGGPYLGLTLMRTSETDEEIDRFVKEWTPIVGKVEIRPVLGFLGRIEDSEYAVVPAERIPCRYLGDRLSIFADGTIVPCPVDVDGEIDLGNVLDGQTIYGAWNSDKYRDLWSRHAFQQWDQLPSPCKTCDSWDFTATDRSTRFFAKTTR